MGKLGLHELSLALHLYTILSGEQDKRELPSCSLEELTQPCLLIWPIGQRFIRASKIVYLNILRHLPTGEPIDLLNVAFENPRKIQGRAKPSREMKKKKRPRDQALENREKLEFDSYLVPDRVTGLEELVELRKLCPHRHWNFVSAFLYDLSEEGAEMLLKVEVDVTFEVDIVHLSMPIFIESL